MLIWYRNSLFASLISIAGCGAGMLAVSFLFSGSIPEGILCAAICAGLLYLGKKTSQKKAFRKWWRQIQKAKLEPEIRQSRETAVEIYKKNPDKQTLKKIRALNPEAAAYIENGYRDKVPKFSTVTVQQTTPVQPQSRHEGKFFCSNCGQQLPSGSKFCSSCGSAVSGQPSGDTAVSAPLSNGYSSNMADIQKTGVRKPILLTIAAVALLAILVAGIYQRVKEKTPDTPTTIPIQTETPVKAKVPINYDVQEKFVHEGGYTFADTFAEPLMGCREFTMEYEIYPLDGESPADSSLCDIYIKTTTGTWEMAASFQLDGTMESHRIYLKEPTDIAAVAVVNHGKLEAYEIRIYDPA